MKKICFFFVLLVALFTGISVYAQAPQINCDFTVATKTCVGHDVKITYIGGASPNATYLWNFDGGTVLSGSGQGPYYVFWNTPGEKHVVLSLQWEGQSCNATRPVVVVEAPDLFHMTGGGTYPAGGAGVPVGLSGSQHTIIYKLFKNGQYANIHLPGTGAPLSFGLITEPGTYTCKAMVDGSECFRAMEGTAVVSTTGPPPAAHLCMVTFDTLTSKNQLIWNKPVSNHIMQFNIYKETYQNNLFTKIAEVPYSAYSVFIDTSSNPLVKSFRYALSSVDSAGHEGEKGPAHKTIHLNINPGIYGFNLIWNHYLGFDFKTYKIHRKLGNNPWMLLDSVASNVDSYTDLYVTGGLATYYIEVVRLEPCSPSLKTNGIESVFSNVAKSAPVGIASDPLSGLLVFPNPVIEKLFFSFPEQNHTVYTAEVFGPDGRRYLESKISGPKDELNLGNLPGGIYFIRLSGGEQVITRKIVKR